MRPRLARYPKLVRNYRVLAIESSCDDACVTLLDRKSTQAPPTIVFEGKKTLDSAQVGGIQPNQAATHNRKQMPGLVKDALKHAEWDKPDVICATRGPGMIGSLGAGYQLAQGLCIAWNVPLVGVNHMLGHMLMCRLQYNGTKPQFPFLSVLVSGGHTMCVLSKSVTDHQVLVETSDIAAGDALDKCGRILGIRGNMIGKEMERFIQEHNNQCGLPDLLHISEPLKNQAGRKDVMQYSFASFETQLGRKIQQLYGELPQDDDLIARLAYESQMAVFRHIITKVKLAIRKYDLDIKDFVCAGGVGSNLTLRKMLKDELGPVGIEEFYFVEPKYCTDNATMIGWAGIELFEQGYTTELDTTVIRKWALPDLLKLYGWKKDNGSCI